MLGRSSSLLGRSMAAVFLTIGFYGLAVEMAGALLFLVYAQVELANRINFRFSLACIVGAGAILWSIFPRPDRFAPPGPRLEKEAHPRLFGTIERVADHVRQAMPAEVYLVPNVNAWVAERGGTAGLGARRVMAIGLPLLQGLTVPQLEGVLTHEFGHYYGGDTKLGPWIYKTRAALARTIVNLGRSVIQAPFRWYGSLFMRVTQAISRRQEATADRLAAEAVGAEIFGSALRAVHGLSPAFQGYWENECVPVIAAGFRPPLADGFAQFLKQAWVASQVDGLVAKEISERTTNLYDSHPSLAERIAALQVPLVEPGLRETEGGPAIGLLNEAERMELQLVRGMLPPDRAASMRSISWTEVGRAVYLPMWARLVEQHAEALRGLTLGGYPSFLKSPDALLFSIRKAIQVVEDAGPMRRRAAGVLGVAMAKALADQGWVVETSPGTPILLRMGETRVDPFEEIPRLADGRTSPANWEEFLRRNGIASDVPVWSAAG